MISAFGKVILLGEHAVVHGHPALAGALDRDVRCVRVEPAEIGRVRVPDWDLDVGADDDHPVATALARLAEAAGAGDRAFAFELRATLPAAAGLGSSAALAVVLARALSSACRGAPDDAEIERLADAAERCFHQRPSGIDVALAARGGLGVFRRGEGLRALAAPPLRLAVGLSGQARSTADMIARVTAALEADPSGAGARLSALGDAAVAGAEALVAGDLPALGALLTAAHQQLAALGVSTARLDGMVEGALGAGALGAKLTGGGGGGAVIALAPGREQQVLAAWRAAGLDGFSCAVGARPGTPGGT